MAQDYAKSFYNSVEWEKVRKGILIRDHYRCRICGESGALEVHHIEHISPANIGDPRITLNQDNLITLCRECHFKQHHGDRKKPECQDGYHFDENGFLVPNKK